MPAGQGHSGRKKNLEGQGNRGKPETSALKPRSPSSYLPGHWMSLWPVIFRLYNVNQYSLAGFLSFVTLSVVPVLYHRSPKLNKLKVEFSSASEDNKRGFEWSYSFHFSLAQGIKYPSPKNEDTQEDHRADTLTKEERHRANAEGLHHSFEQGFEMIPCT